MLERKIVILFMLLSIGLISGQSLIKTDKRYPPIEFKANKLDISKNNFFYDYTFVPNPKNKDKSKSTITVLQIGRKFSKFTDFSILKLDSIQKSQSSLKTVGAAEINSQLAYLSSIVFEKIVYKDLSNNNIIFQSKIHSKRYEYEINSPVFKWKLERDQKTILGYKTQKATVNYGGRSWVAWFTNDIPISSGPYLFTGLPGLILEIYDSKNNFHFVISGVNNISKEIFKRNEGTIIKTTQKEFNRAEKNYFSRPGMYIDAYVKGVDKFKAIPYNPIELTY